MKLKPFQIGVKRAAVTGLLGMMLVVPFAALAHLGLGPAVPSAAARSALSLQEVNVLTPVGRAYQAYAVVLRHNALHADSADFVSVLAGAALFLPFGLSTLGLSCRNRFALPCINSQTVYRNPQTEEEPDSWE